ncbi:hypothetical protein Rhopal_003816-T1 [Rhodotorula paludigena]|uniref:Magnesium transporter n=1 Tax=Rhodotorula paludigena TaxID=86838 RepID=A0AAV5GP59_9BASI|nr:hypothetical protein Rhopal_003816-T1 [Rhodotorula paludigena]
MLSRPGSAGLQRVALSTSISRSTTHTTRLSRSAAQEKESQDPIVSSGSTDSDAADAGHGGIAYTRHELLADWHSYARKVSPLDVRWHGKDQIDANYMIIRPDGSIEDPDEKLDKQAIIEQFGLLPRDLRSLDAHILDVRPALIVCQRSLIICTPVIRAIIAPDQLVLIGTDRDNPICNDEQSVEMAEALQKVMAYLELTGSATGRSNTPPFELRALEAVLLLTVRGIKNVVTELQERVYRTIPALRFGVSPAELRDLLECKRTVEDCLQSGRAMQSALSTVLGEDEDMANMYLTDKAKGNARDISDHTQAELLLEYYERRLDETSESCERLSTLLSEVDSNISLVLASTRVRLQNLELQTAIGTLSLGAGATVAGFFGMNLTSGLEEHPSAFYWTVGLVSSMMVGVTAISWVRLIRARRSQLFLRSIRPKRDGPESLGSRWSAGPVGETPSVQGGKKDVRDVDVHKDVEKATGQADGGVQTPKSVEEGTGQGKGKKAVAAGEKEAAMHEKDGSTL